MREVVSKFTYGISWLAVVLTVIATCLWLRIVLDDSGWGGFGFRIFVGPELGAFSLFLGVIPSGILVLQKRQRRDVTSLLMSGCSFLTVAGEIALLCVIPLNGC